MADEDETHIDIQAKSKSYAILLELHDSINDVKNYNGRLDERIKILERIIFWVCAAIAMGVLSLIGAAVIAFMKGVF